MFRVQFASLPIAVSVGRPGRCGLIVLLLLRHQTAELFRSSVRTCVRGCHHLTYYALNLVPLHIFEGRALTNVSRLDVA